MRIRALDSPRRGGVVNSFHQDEQVVDQRARIHSWSPAKSFAGAVFRTVFKTAPEDG